MLAPASWGSRAWGDAVGIDEEGVGDVGDEAVRGGEAVRPSGRWLR